jgi:hypothetical protein
MRVRLADGGRSVEVEIDPNPTVLASDGVVLAQALGEVAIGLWQQLDTAPAQQDGPAQSVVSAERAPKGYNDQYGFEIGQGQPLPVE